MVEDDSLPVDPNVLGVAAGIIVSDGGIERLVNVADEMHYEVERLETHSIRLGFVCQYGPYALIFVNYTTVLADRGDVAVAGRVERDGNVDEVPCARILRRGHGENVLTRCAHRNVGIALKLARFVRTGGDI
jgi:hypothetical protein